MSVSTFFILSSLFALSSLVGADDPQYSFCLYSKYDQSLCKGVEVGESRVACSPVIDSVDCALKLLNGSVDFGIFTAEEAVLVSKFVGSHTKYLNAKIQVLGELRHHDRVTEPYSVQQVVVARSNFTNYKGSKYCHQGFSTRYTDRVLKYFEKKMVDMKCNPNYSGIEQEVAYLSDFFGAACRPGPWAQDPEHDKYLKGTYKNLCQLCPNNECTSTENEEGRAALNCLTSNGDIAYVDYRSVQKYFGLLPEYRASAAPEDYGLVCPDEPQSLKPLNATCSWVKQPWSLILTKREAPETLQEELMGWLNNTGDSEWMTSLRDLLLDRKRLVAVKTVTPTLLGDYIDRGGCDEKQEDVSCREKKWCTVGEGELAKCRWLKTASETHGMVPTVNCISANSTFSCLRIIANKKADVAGIDTRYGYLARKIHNMTSVVYEDNAHSVYFKIIAVKKKSNSLINTFADIKGKNVCFPEYRGIGWLSFLKVARGSKLLDNTCPERFFSGGCAPGASDREHLVATEPALVNLCQACPPTNQSDPCATENNPFYGDLGAMQCLLKDAGDVTFVDYYKLQKSDGSLDQSIDQNSLTVICKNGSLSTITGLNVDDQCAIATGIIGEILTRDNNSAVAERDLSELFLKLNNWLGGANPRGVFKMFEKFQGEKDLLFMDGTVSLVHRTEYPMIKSYTDLLEISENECSASNVIMPTLTTSLFALCLCVFALLRFE